jgi:hypothetical protein
MTMRMAICQMTKAIRTPKRKWKMSTTLSKDPTLKPQTEMRQIMKLALLNQMTRVTPREISRSGLPGRKFATELLAKPALIEHLLTGLHQLHP